SGARLDRDPWAADHLTFPATRHEAAAPERSISRDEIAPCRAIGREGREVGGRQQPEPDQLITETDPFGTGFLGEMRGRPNGLEAAGFRFALRQWPVARVAA